MIISLLARVQRLNSSFYTSLQFSAVPNGHSSISPKHVFFYSIISVDCEGHNVIDSTPTPNNRQLSPSPNQCPPPQLHSTCTPRFNQNIEGKGWGEEQANTASAVEHINALSPRPKFVVVCGDLINSYPADPDGQVAETDAFKETMSVIHKDIALVCVCGNHDVGNRPSNASVQLYRDRFGDDYASFWCGGCKIFLLNSSLLQSKEPALWKPTEAERTPKAIAELKAGQAEALGMAQAMQEWLGLELSALGAGPAAPAARGGGSSAAGLPKGARKGKGRVQPVHSMVFSHIPPFIHSPTEPKGTWSSASLALLCTAHHFLAFTFLFSFHSRATPPL